MNVWDQTDLMRELNGDLQKSRGEDQYATAIILGYNRLTGELVFVNAGHPSPLWYRANNKAWEWLDSGSLFLDSVSGLPLGLISGMNYAQQATQLAPGDMLILYTDGIHESRNPASDSLGPDGLMEIVCTLPTGSPIAAAHELLSALRSFRGSIPTDDDESLVVLQAAAG